MPADRPPGTLFVVSTPIGNMGDFSFRAVEVLKQVNGILAEDTRHTRHLLDRYEISTPMISYHEHVEARMTPGLVRRLESGETLALVSDAGTPLLSDPGFELVRRVAQEGMSVVAVPGPSAITAALSIAGLPTERFSFEGFLPARLGERRARVSAIYPSSSSGCGDRREFGRGGRARCGGVHVPLRSQDQDVLQQARDCAERCVDAR